MASSEALIKYYDCLKDSFNKIQVKDNKTSLVNAALRPKIREEFAKSKGVLVSYLNYLRVFTLIYSDKFSTICISIICPLFKDNPSVKTGRSITESSTNSIDHQNETNKTNSQLVHETLRTIFKSKPELIDDFIHSVIRLFPSAYTDDEKTFTSYLSNALEICTYIRGESLTNLVARILDRVNPPTSSEPLEEEKLIEIRNIIKASYDLIYELVDSLESKQLENVSAAILAAFTREFLTSENENAVNHLLLYLCSKDEKLSDLFINLLWANFTDTDRSFDERRVSVLYASSFMSRANYIDLEKVMNHIETASLWCDDLISNSANLERHDQEVDIPNQASDLFYPLVESILYLITQRYREMYEEETIVRLKKMNLNNILNCYLKPLEACNPQTVARFYEVSTLYGLSSLQIKIDPQIKRRKSSNDSPGRPREWKIPFKDHCDSLPSRIANLYRTYYNHRNFTVYRE